MIKIKDIKAGPCSKINSLWDGCGKIGVDKVLRIIYIISTMITTPAFGQG